MNRSYIDKITVLIPKLTYFSKRNFWIFRLRAFKIWASFSKTLELSAREEVFEKCIKTLISRLGVKVSKNRGIRGTRIVNGSRTLVSKHKRICPSPERLAKKREIHCTDIEFWKVIKSIITNGWLILADFSEIYESYNILHQKSSRYTISKSISINSLRRSTMEEMLWQIIQILGNVISEERILRKGSF